MGEHLVSVPGGEAAGLGAEVKEDGVGLPPAQGPDGSLVDAGDEQGGGTTRAEAVGLDLVGRDVGDVLDSGGGSSQGMGDFSGGDVTGSGVVVIVSVEWSAGGGLHVRGGGGRVAGQHGRGRGQGPLRGRGRVLPRGWHSSGRCK